MQSKLESRIWWDYLHEDLKELLQQSQLLMKMVKARGGDLPSGKNKFHDYAFIVFPAAKAYEGFLKTFFLDLGFIKEEDYYGKRFRVGKALNPALDRRYRKTEGVYDQLVKYCNGRALADKLLSTWKKCRNLLFHWFPNEKNAISFKRARDKTLLILDTMDEAFKECKMKEVSNT